MNEQLIQKDIEAHNRRIEILEHAVFGNSKKGIKEELVELKTEFHTLKKLVFWQIGIGVAILCAIIGKWV